MTTRSLVSAVATPLAEPSEVRGHPPGVVSRAARVGVEVGVMALGGVGEPAPSRPADVRGSHGSEITQFPKGPQAAPARPTSEDFPLPDGPSTGDAHPVATEGGSTR